MHSGMDHNAGYYEVDPRASSYYRDMKAYYEPMREYPSMPEYHQEPVQRTNINPRSFSRSAEYHPMGFDGGDDEVYVPRRRIASELDAVAVLTKISHIQTNTETLIIMMYVLIILVSITIVAVGALMMHQVYRQISG